MNSTKKIYIAGHNGMVGSAILNRLSSNENVSLVTGSRKELDLTDQKAVQEFFELECPDEVYLAAAKVGGIFANKTFPADFIYQNLMIQSNVINAAFRSGVEKLLFLGSSCIYPRLADQPMTEECLLSGMLEPTNEPYAIAKIAGIKLCESYNRQYGVDYRSVMPTNLYGKGDYYHLENSHVIPALIRKFHEAKCKGDKEVIVWGSGLPLREFLYVDDLADACEFVMNLSRDKYNSVIKDTISHINIGFGTDITIKQLAESISKVVSFEGNIEFDSSMPDGTPKKLMDSGKLNRLGWRPKVDLIEGLQMAYADFCTQNIRKTKYKEFK